MNKDGGEAIQCMMMHIIQFIKRKTRGDYSKSPKNKKDHHHNDQITHNHQGYKGGNEDKGQKISMKVMMISFKAKIIIITLRVS